MMGGDVPRDVVDAEHKRLFIGRGRRRRGEGEHGAFVESGGQNVQTRPKAVTVARQTTQCVDSWRLADDFLDATRGFADLVRP
jgi:hypothetical protein